LVWGWGAGARGKQPPTLLLQHVTAAWCCWNGIASGPLSARLREIVLRLGRHTRCFDARHACTVRGKCSPPPPHTHQPLRPRISNGQWRVTSSVWRHWRLREGKDGW